MASAVAGLIFNHEGQLLMTVRAGEPAKGSLDLPGGFVDMGETAQEALRREIKEELQIDAEVEEFVGSYPNQYLFGGVLYETLDLVFRCKVNDFKTITAGDDVAGIRFVDINTLDLNTIGLFSIREIVSSLRKRKSDLL
jgi:mutator protein MutT